MRPLYSVAIIALIAACTEPPKPAANPKPLEAVKAAVDPGPPPRVVIVGGGLAGLTTAYELEKRGIRSHLLEANDVFGGRVQTAYYADGLNAEYGMQEMWLGNPLLDIAKELKVELDGEPEPAFSSVIIDDKMRPFIQDSTKEYFASFLDAKEQKALESWMASARVLREEAEKDGLKSEKMKKLQSISFAQWLKDLQLPKKVQDWVNLTLECELAVTADQFSALAGLLELGIFLADDTPNFHVKGGNSKLIEAIAGAIKSPKTLSAMVTEVRRTKTADGKFEVEVEYLKDHKVEHVKAERAVIAVPFFRLHQIKFDPPMSDDRWASIQGLGLGQYTVVHLLITKDTAQLWNINGQSPLPVLSSGPLGVIYGVQKETAPEQPLEVFAMLVYGMRARMFHMVPRDVKLREILGELDKLWPGFSTHVKDSFVYTYHPASLAVWPPGQSPIDEGMQAVRTPEWGTYLAGDWTLGSHSDHAVKSGIDTAKQIAAELGK